MRRLSLPRERGRGSVGRQRQALIIESDAAARSRLRRLVERAGWRVTVLATVSELDAAATAQDWPLVLCALDPTARGWAQLGALRQQLGADAYLVVLGDARDALSAVSAVLQGASDYLAQPVAPAALRRVLQTVQHEHTLAAQESWHGTPVLPPTPAPAEPVLLGTAPALVQVVRQLAQALAARQADAPTHRPPSFLLTGETGTGKELFARLVHQHSPFAAGPLIAVNCSTLPADLAEAELFGHEAGAFTGAQQARAGLWEQAAGGTLVLDEITEAPPVLWPKLLRVLQDGVVKRLGGTGVRPVRVQVIAASNRDIAAEVAQGRFRRDVWQRFVHHFHLPPLRARGADIALLAEHFASCYARAPVQLSREAYALLQSYAWPGNVRELEHVLRRAMSGVRGGRLTAAELTQHLAGWDTATRKPGPTQTASPRLSSLAASVREFKRRLVRETLGAQGGNITQTAAVLGLTRAAIYKILAEKSPEG